MAYAAVISLKQTLHLLRSSPHISFLSTSSPEILKLATTLQQVLERSDDSSSRKSCRLNALDAQIRQTVHEFEDLLELHVSSNHFLPESESHGDESARLKINSFLETMKMMEKEYVDELENSSPQEEDNISSNTDFGVKMVGLSNEFKDIKSKLLKSIRPDDFGVFSFVGMAGSGRSMIAKTIFDHIYNGREQSLDCGAMVTVGPNYQLKEIYLSILSQINDASIASNDELNISSQGDEELLGYHLYSSLKGRKYMIVIDDVWETRVWDDLRRSFPDQKNGSLVVITTSLKEVALYADCCRIFQIPVLDEDRTWHLLCVAIFGVNSSCPQELEESGKLIVKNIEGRIHSLAKVILFLLKAEEMVLCWNEVAADKEHSIFLVADELSEVNSIWEDLQVMCASLRDDDQRKVPALRMVATALNSSLSVNSLEPFKDHMFPDYMMPKIEFMSLLGMPGIGKTTLAKEIFKDQSILDHFDHHAWVTLGPRYQPEDILADVLLQIFPDIDKMSVKGDGPLAKELCAKLSKKRFFIVLDDVWNTEALQQLENLFKKMKAKVLVTTRLAYVARFSPIYKIIIRLPLLNKEESWSLLCQKVFPEGSCPIPLEKAGKRILEHCDGLPLLILMVASHLCKAEKKLEYWNQVADQKQNEVFKNAHSEISKALLPSYESLPQHLKACFLYMGIFRRNHWISNSNIIRLWDAEGFLEPKQTANVEDFAEECLEKLVDKSFVMGSYFEIGTCRLHSVFWHLSNSEAEKSNFLHAFTSFADSTIEDMEGQRRLCIRNSTLLGIKDVHDSIASIPTTRSLLCTGPPHQYPVPICFGLKLLRVLDALTIRLYEFPDEVVRLIHLRYLALTCSGKLPASISNLCSLHYLIVAQHLTIKSSEDLLLLPAEIWNMKELKYLHTTGRSLTSPQSGAILPNLSTLLDVSGQSCTDEFFKGIPNLLKLGIQIELDPDDGNGNPFHCLDHISGLKRLESLECVVVNPEFGFEVVSPPAPIPMFPLGLKKLSLSGLGYPWEYMSIIGKLQKLEVLELRCFSFKGTTWVTNAYSFPEVQLLLLEDIDLVRWKLESFSFKNLEFLSIKHCYNLEDLPHNFSSTVAKIEAVDCNTFVKKWADEVKEVDLNNMHVSRPFLEVESHSSWDDRKIN
ncbi:hypothetical protein C2S53_006290 [Perilla frutescens var. hirtella]|uniref:NB-ARC domain-containing protein n=1 Tax=Perilla frutescens var. hirtella TaxID=608512 RepID=A0AAD4ITY8_PERFH|nr:hypothetical protein C2S53_006290 [Perilla frutescens var. hirtella]